MAFTTLVDLNFLFKSLKKNRLIGHCQKKEQKSLKNDQYPIKLHLMLQS